MLKNSTGHFLKITCNIKYDILWNELLYSVTLKSVGLGFPGGAVVENLPANAGDTGLSPGLGRSHMPRSD